MSKNKQYYTVALYPNGKLSIEQVDPAMVQITAYCSTDPLKCISDYIGDKEKLKREIKTQLTDLDDHLKQAKELQRQLRINKK